MSNATPRSQQPPLQDIRAALGRGGGMRPGKIEKAQDPRHALTRLTMYLSPYKATLILVMAFVLAYILLGLLDRKSTRLNSSHIQKSRMPSSA